MNGCLNIVFDIVPSANVEPEDMESLEGEEGPDVEAVTPTDLPLSPQEPGIYHSVNLRNKLLCGVLIV